MKTRMLRDIKVSEVVMGCMAFSHGYGKITTETKFERNDDVRNWVPQLSKPNIEGNRPIVEMLNSAEKNSRPWKRN